MERDESIGSGEQTEIGAPLERPVVEDDARICREVEEVLPVLRATGSSPRGKAAMKASITA
jgi:hypothetical protein